MNDEREHVQDAFGVAFALIGSGPDVPKQTFKEAAQSVDIIFCQYHRCNGR